MCAEAEVGIRAAAPIAMVDPRVRASLRNMAGFPLRGRDVGPLHGAAASGERFKGCPPISGASFSSPNTHKMQVSPSFACPSAPEKGKLPPFGGGQVIQ